MKEYVFKKSNQGVTLIALVITIIVLLILAGVSITALIGEKGIITQANDSKDETRAGSIEEARDLWEIHNESIDEPIPLEELLIDLKAKNLITSEEEQAILNSNPPTIVIASKTIIFHEKDLLSGENPIEIESFVGQYADFENESGERIPDGIPDGIIFADLASTNGRASQQSIYEEARYVIPQIDSGLKSYYVQKENLVDSRWSETESKRLISPVKGSEGLDRFYVMELEDIDNNFYTWYSNAINLMFDYDIYTSIDFGKGKENSNRMIERSNFSNGTIPQGYSNAGTIPYGSINSNDIWCLEKLRRKISEGWFVPSAGEFSAFVNELGISLERVDNSYFENYKLEYCYWTSSQCGYSESCTIDFEFGDIKYGYITANSVDCDCTLRLASTF